MHRGRLRVVAGRAGPSRDCSSLQLQSDHLRLLGLFIAQHKRCCH